MEQRGSDEKDLVRRRQPAHRPGAAVLTEAEQRSADERSRLTRRPPAMSSGRTTSAASWRRR